MQHFHNSRGWIGGLKRLKPICAIAICLPAFALAACGPGIGNDRVSRQDLQLSQEILADVYETELAMSPETASMLGIEDTRPEAVKFNLDDHSQAGFERRRLTRIELSQRLKSRPALPATLEIAKELQIADFTLDQLIALEQTGHGRYTMARAKPYPLDPFSGIWIEGPYLLTRRHTIDTNEDARAYLVRLNLLAAAIDDTRRRLLADESVGHTPPKFLIADLKRRIEALLSEQHLTLPDVQTTLANLTLGISDISPEQRRAYINEANAALSADLRPAYRRLLATLDDLSETAPQQAGLWAQPAGYDTYLSLIRFYLSSDASLDSMHANNLNRVSVWKMDIETQLEFPEDTEIPQNLQAKLALHNALIAAADESPPIKPLPDAPEIGTRQTLTPIWTFLDILSQQTDLPRHLMPAVERSIASHSDREIQAPLNEKLIPYSALVQGFQLYKSDSDARQPLGVKHTMLIEAVLAAADSGLNHAKWSFPETVGYIYENTGLSEDIATQAALWVASNPGYETSKLTAYRRISALSERANAVLGARYNEQSFQSVILKDGPRPLSMIEDDIERWYAEQIGAPTSN